MTRITETMLNKQQLSRVVSLHINSGSVPWQCPYTNTPALLRHIRQVMASTIERLWAEQPFIAM